MKVTKLGRAPDKPWNGRQCKCWDCGGEFQLENSDEPSEQEYGLGWAWIFKCPTLNCGNVINVNLYD